MAFTLQFSTINHFKANVCDEYLLQAPNGLGTLLGAAQLVLYVIYKKSTPKKIDKDKDNVEIEIHAI